MRHILVPTDFSDCATWAAQTAIEIAKLSGGEVHFLHYMSIPINWIQMEQDQEKLYPDITEDVNHANSELMRLISMAEKHGVSAHHFLGYNESSANIVRHITEQSIDLVVMGSHGASGLREMFIGSNAQRIVRLSPVPVMIIKKPMKSIHIPDILFVSDFEPEAISAFERLVGFAEMVHAKIHLININTPTYFSDTWEIKSKMEPFLLMAGDLLKNTEILDAYVFEDGLQKHCMGFEQAIVAMATHGRRGISRIFYGSVTEKIVNHIPFPVLSFRIKETNQEAYLQSIN